MKATREQAYQAIDSERDYQQSLIRAAGRYEEETKPLEAYVLYMNQYLEKVKNNLSFCWGPKSIEAALEDLRKVAALAVAAMETHGAPKRMSRTVHPELPGHNLVEEDGTLTPVDGLAVSHNDVPF